jgi:hypothetical protein
VESALLAAYAVDLLRELDRPAVRAADIALS